MKFKSYILICLLSWGMVSCNNWLDVKPETEMTLDEIFSSQQGFQDALTGAYLDLKNPAAYGGDLMFGAVEFLAQHWDYTAESVEEKISRFNYIDEGVRSKFASVYSQLYKVIASANMVLAHIDANRDVFEGRMYEIVKGEALAMRAYCHLDVLRLFGPMPSQPGQSRILPYVRKADISYNPHHTYQEFTKFLEADLLEAEKLLKAADPMLPEWEETIGQYSVSARNFLQSRQLRFNYYAVKATEARFYLWLGGDENKSKAYLCANEVIESKGNKKTLLFELGNTDDIAQKDYSFSSEHIMAVYDFKLPEKADENFTVSAIYSKKKALLQTDLWQAGTTDIRSTSLWGEYTAANGAKSYSTKKFLQPEGEEETAIPQLPLLRLAEMYFIAMECGTLEVANRLYKEFCISRDVEPIDLADLGDVERLLVTEYNKEFYAEGQAFYAFKRLGVEDILWAEFPGNAESYVLPLPLNEINYGN